MAVHDQWKRHDVAIPAMNSHRNLFGRNLAGAVAQLDLPILNQSNVSALVMGILNVTPDSFSDGGAYVHVDRAAARASEMIDQGADIIDVGPESTRPGSQPVSADEQTARALPVIESIRASHNDIPISIDTRLASVAQAAIDSGANWINDVSALCDDPAMVDVVRDSGAPVVLMHRRGSSVDMQRGGGPHYEDVVCEIADFLKDRRDYAVQHGIEPRRIILDPGIGFGKRRQHNILILKHIEVFAALGHPLMVGASRKSFLAKIVEQKQAKDRDSASIACCVAAMLSVQRHERAGPLVFRVHDVLGTRQALQLCDELVRADDADDPGDDRRWNPLIVEK